LARIEESMHERLIKLGFRMTWTYSPTAAETKISVEGCLGSIEVKMNHRAMAWDDPEAGVTQSLIEQLLLLMPSPKAGLKCDLCGVIGCKGGCFRD
jgi:hypothetical protein